MEVELANPIGAFSAEFSTNYNLNTFVHVRSPDRPDEIRRSTKIIHQHFTHDSHFVHTSLQTIEL
jgi:hypothetical protein